MTPEPPDRADTLAEAATEEEYQQRLVALLREKSAVDTASLSLPASPGVRGTLMRPIRILLWKLLRHQHDAVVARHNAVHAVLASALEYEHDLRRKRIAELEQRIDLLERSSPPRTNRTGHDHAP